MSKTIRNDDVWNVQSDDLIIMSAAPIGTGAFAVVFKGFLKELPPVFRSDSRSLSEMNWSSDKQMMVAVKCPHNQARPLFLLFYNFR